MNKYTRAIDKLFENYGKDSDQYILLGCCHDDYDLGELGYFSVSSVLEKLEGFHEREADVLDPYPYGVDENDKAATDLNEAFEKDLKKFLNIMNRAFPSFFEENYEGTNVYWYRCYFATRDHKLFQVLTSDWDPKDRDWEEIIELDKLTEKKIDDESDKANLEKIYEHLNMIKCHLKELKSDHSRKKAVEKISKTCNL